MYFYQPIETPVEKFALNPFTRKIIGSRNSRLGATAVFRAGTHNTPRFGLRYRPPST